MNKESAHQLATDLANAHTLEDFFKLRTRAKMFITPPAPSTANEELAMSSARRPSRNGAAWEEMMENKIV